MAKLKRHPVTVRRVADRRYRSYFLGESGRRVGVDLIAPAEYAVFVNGEEVARIVKADGWRVVKPSARSRFGVAVSPVGLDRFGSVKEFARKYFCPPLRRRGLRRAESGYGQRYKG